MIDLHKTNITPADKAKKENFVVALLIIMIGSKGSLLAISDVTLVLATLCALFMFRKRNLFFDPSFILLTLCYILLTCAYYYKFEWINYTSSARTFLKIFYAYLTIKIVKEDFFVLFEKILYKFALISLPLYAWQLLDYDSLRAIISILERSVPALDHRGEVQSNLFLFTLNDKAMLRNSGCAWEPKGFANMLVLATFINLMMNNFKSNKRLKVFLVAIATTFSTAGYAVLVIVGSLFLARNIQHGKVFFALPVFVGIALYVFSLDFMMDKIAREYETRYYTQRYVTAKVDIERRSMGRFGSMLLDLQDFRKSPMIGIGMQNEERVTRGVYTYLVRVNGFSEVLARFGIVGMLFFVSTLLVAFHKLCKLYGARGAPFLALGVLLISFGTAIFLNPLWMAFFMFAFVRMPRAETSTGATHLFSVGGLRERLV